MSSFQLQTCTTESGSQLLSRLLRGNSLEFLDSSLFPNGLKEEVVEISGESGVGKSQLLTHLLVRCITPKSWKNHQVGGVEVGVIFIDTDHHFPMFRVIGLIECKLKSCLEKSAVLTAEEMHEFVMSCLERLFIAKCSDSLQLTATLQCMSQTSEYRKRGYKVIMIDSLSSFYWEDEMTKIRTAFELRNFYRHLASVLQKLVEHEEFTLFFTRLAFRKSTFKSVDNRKHDERQSNVEEEYYYLGKEIQKLPTFKLTLSKSKCGGHTTLNVTHNSKSRELRFKIIETGLQLI